MPLIDYHKSPSSIYCFDLFLSSATDIALATGILTITPVLTNFGHSLNFLPEDVAKTTCISVPTTKNAVSSLIVAKNDTTDSERTWDAGISTGEVTPFNPGHSYFTRAMGAVGDDANGQSNKEWSRAGNSGRLVRNPSGSGSHGTGNGNAEGSNGGGDRGVGGGGSGNGDSDGLGGSAGGLDRRPPSERRSSAEGSSKWTLARRISEDGGAPPPPPPPPPQVASAVDDDRPGDFPSHQNYFQLFDWVITVVGLAVLVSLAKRALHKRKEQRINASVDICPVASCPTVVRIAPDMCLRPDLASVYDPSPFPPSRLPRQEPRYDHCEKVLDGVRFNFSTAEAFAILNGAACSKSQNGADMDCGSLSPANATPTLSWLDTGILFIFSPVFYFMGYVHRLLVQRRGTPTDQHPGTTSNPGINAPDDASVDPDAFHQAASNIDSSRSGPSPSLTSSIASSIPTVATPSNLPRFLFIPVLDTPERHRTRRLHQDDRPRHYQADVVLSLSDRSSSSSGSSSSNWSFE